MAQGKVGPSFNQATLIRGAALTELAILLLLFLFLVLTFTEMGITIRRSNTILEASRAGARAGAATSTSAWNCSGLPSPGTQTCGATSGYSDPIAESAYQATCSYLGSLGYQLAEWSVTISYRVANGGSLEFPFIDLSLVQSHAAPANCILCIGGVLSSTRLNAFSSFAIQKRCP